MLIPAIIMCVGWRFTIIRMVITLLFPLLAGLMTNGLMMLIR